MGRKRIGIQGELFADYMERLDKLGGTNAMVKGVKRALTESKKYVNPQIEKAMRKGNLPARGKYSTGKTLQSLDYSYQVDTISGFVYSMKIGFNFNESGLKSIFLMYGTPRMKPVAGLKNAIYGRKTQTEIVKIQSEALNQVIKEIMEG